MFRRVLSVGNVKNGIKVFENRGFHKGCTSFFMHERHPNVEENRKRIGIVGGSICAGQVCILTGIILLGSKYISFLLFLCYSV